MARTDTHKSWRRRRPGLVSGYHEALERAVELDIEGRGDLAAVFLDRLGEIADAYVELLPVRPISRDPLSGEVVSYCIDDSDLDGPWWNYEAPARPAVQPVPTTYFALTGALRLGGAPTPAPFLCKPGPAVPYVIPRLLERPGVTAVVSSLPIGAHTGYAILYSSDPQPTGIERANTWGTGSYVVEDDGRPTWGAVVEDFDDFDFELAPWIRSGKLAWIAPGDDKLALRTDGESCPYLGLDGSREFPRIQNGRVWHPSDVSHR